MSNNEPRIIEKSNNRLTHIDVAKGLGILLTVFGHTLVFSGFVESRAFATIYAFHMPFFFFLSGYLYKRKPSKAFLSGKVKNLLFPILIYQSLNILMYFITWCFGKTAYYGKISFGGFWFVLTLLFITVIHFFVETVIERLRIGSLSKNVVFAIIGIIFLALGLIYSKSISDKPNQPIATAFVGYFFFDFGMLYKRATEGFRTKVLNWGVRLCAFILGCGLLTALYFTSKMNECTVDMNTSRYGTLHIFVIQAIIGIAGLYLISWAINKNKMLQFFGRNSLVILMIHIPISKLVPFVCERLISSHTHAITLLINTVLSIVISAFMVWLFNKYLPIMTGKFNWEIKNDGEKISK